MNLTNWDIYLSRLVSAMCLFLILSEANIWLDPVNNTLLVLGYRLFILFTPLLFLLFRHQLTFIAFLITECGLILWLSDYTMPGTILFATGIAVSGYMLKYYSSFSTQGAAGNKIALNLGSIATGAIVAISQNKEAILAFSFCVILISLFSFTKYYHRAQVSQFNVIKNHFSLKNAFTKKGLAWSLIGFVTGVKLIAIISILPQLLIIHNQGKLPIWFGSIIIINSLLIVFFQIPIMNKMKSLNLTMATIPLFIAILIITLSSQMNITSFTQACIWTICLAFIECAISYLDKLAQDDGLLLIKEASVGIGSAATVVCVRFFNPPSGTLTIGIVSAILLLVCFYMFKKDENMHVMPACF
jgi:hypothetical protein